MDEGGLSSRERLSFVEWLVKWLRLAKIGIQLFDFLN